MKIRAVDNLMTAQLEDFLFTDDKSVPSWFNPDELKQYRELAERGIARCELELDNIAVRTVTNRLIGKTDTYEVYADLLREEIGRLQKVLDKLGGLNNGGRVGISRSVR